jgi:hypothetical protein
MPPKINPFAPAVKEKLRARVALVGPTGCLAGDTEILVNRGGAGRRMPIAKVVHSFNGGVTHGPRGDRRRWDPTIPTRVQRADDGVMRLGTLARAVDSGERLTYTLTTVAGRTIRATGEHPFLTETGWTKLADLTAGENVAVNGGRSATTKKPRKWYRLVSGIPSHPQHGRRGVVNGKGGFSVPMHRLVVEADMNDLTYEEYVNRLRSGDVEGLVFLSPEVDVHHADHDTRNNALVNLEVLNHNEHLARHATEGGGRHVLEQMGWEAIASIEEFGLEPTFDLTLAEEPHNYVANGFVVHNSGKTWQSLVWATVLAGDDGKIALIDTENDSAKLFADTFKFDTMDFQPPYSLDDLVDRIRDAEEFGYDVCVVDSFTHFWSGEGGTLDIVDAAAQRNHGNTFAGWKVGTPALRHVIDVMRSSHMHIIITMRSKMEWVVEKDERTGKSTPRKLGLAPEMRAGIEYEFTVVGDIDLEHRMVITKSRCDLIADKVAEKARIGEIAETFAAWLDSGVSLASADDVADITAAFNLKEEFMEVWGRPTQLLADQVDPALSWIAERTPDNAIEGRGPGWTPQSGEDNAPYENGVPDVAVADDPPETEDVDTEFDATAELEADAPPLSEPAPARARPAAPHRGN